MAQEALANVAKHSGAENVEVKLDWQDERLTLTVADDGRGFAPGTESDGFGLRSIQDRIAGVGGSFRVESSPGEGTSVVCACPLDPKHEPTSVERERRTT